MYDIIRSKDFEASIKRLKSSGIKSSLKKKIEKTIDLLKLGKKLPTNYKDHKLNGELSNYRECHIKANLLLVYRIKKKKLILILINIGSHSKLFD